MRLLLISLFFLYFSLSGEDKLVETIPTSLKSEIFVENATWQTLSSGHAGCEGAQWIVEDGVPTLYYGAHHDFLAYKWTEKDGLKVWRDDSPEATSFRPDGKGGYLVVEQTTRRVTLWDKDAKMVEVLAERYEGKMLNRPNDARLRSDQTLWFTDPPALFKKRPYEVKELEGQYVFRYDLKTKKLMAVIKETLSPNGIVFSPDEKQLFVGDKGILYCWDVSASGDVSNKVQFVPKKIKGLDGLSIDPQGRLWACAFDSIMIFDLKGHKVGEIKTPGKPTSVDFSVEAKLVCITTRDAGYLVKLK